MELDKCENRDWFNWNNLPQSPFILVQNLVRKNYNLFIEY